jgi:flavin-dependent dehydrogenase
MPLQLRRPPATPRGATVDADVAVVGGGPAGLAAAIAAARRGLRAIVLERRDWPQDKACGEGLMPAGVRALERLGVRALIDPQMCAPFAGVRYVQEDGSFAQARFPTAGGDGLGVRRPALSVALLQRARELGVALRARARVQRLRRRPTDVALDLQDGAPVYARLVVAADGLASPLRRSEGLEAAARGPRRYGLRRHYQRTAWSPLVEVHFAAHVEAYVTPTGADCVGVAFLWEDGAVPQPVSYESLLARFPRLREQLAGAPCASEPRGAGPFLRRARARTAERLVLLGDAGGYVDAITGEGLSLAFHCAEALGAILPAALARGATRASLAAYERAYARAFRSYALLSHSLLVLSRHPRLRRHVVRQLGRMPQLFSTLLAWLAREPSLPAADAVALR